MMRHLVVAIALTACAGCATTGGKVTAIVGAAAAGGAVVAFTGFGDCEHRTDNPVFGCTAQAATVATLVVVSGLSFLTSMIIEIYSAPDLPPTPPRNQ
ncbi:MAG TPA: hypothetical protein VHW23_33290 [Kofleriaceae bacterium]|jgi:hypothetical protein|nr:hypothetical protein [Kofleriaceae bacterium]